MKIWKWITAILSAAAGFLYIQVLRGENKALKRDIAENEAEKDAFDKADEALAEGIKNEQNTNDNDSYDFKHD